MIKHIFEIRFGWFIFTDYLVKGECGHGRKASAAVIAFVPLLRHMLRVRLRDYIEPHKQDIECGDYGKCISVSFFTACWISSLCSGSQKYKSHTQGYPDSGQVFADYTNICFYTGIEPTTCRSQWLWRSHLIHWAIRAIDVFIEKCYFNHNFKD